jgi:hypothetical protein
MRKNWLNMKIGLISKMDLPSLEALDYRSDDYYRALKPSVTQIKENSFLVCMQNVQSCRRRSNQAEDGELAAKKKRIDELKQQLLQPFQK